MAMPALMPRIWTAAEVQALPDDPSNRYECVDGELLVSPSPRTLHQSAVSVLIVTLDSIVRSAGVGVVFVAPSDWVLDPRTLVQPDLYVVPLVDGRRPRTDEERGHPLLFVEILSPSTRRRDEGIKRKLFEEKGIRENWIVDPKGLRVTVYRRGDEGQFPRLMELAAGQALNLETPLLPGFALSIDDLFAPV